MRDRNKKFFTAVVLAGLVMVDSVSLVLAAPVEIPVDAVCCKNSYQVYGDEQPRPVGQDCSVQVDLDPAFDKEDLQGEPFESSPLSPLDSLSTAASSAISPFQALFEQLEVKRGLVSLARNIFKGHTELYHEFLDEEIFGNAVSQVSEWETSEELETFLKDSDGECDGDNPQPYCVIERAMCSYEKYTGVLFHQTGQSITNEAFNSADLQTVLTTLQERDAALYREAIHSQEALDTAIAVYSQFYQTYRLHLRFKEVIDSLVKVRNLTAVMRTLVGCIPNKFVGVATTKCD